MNKCKYLEDAKGNKSSKRLWGSTLLMIGIGFAVIAFFMSLFHPLGDSRTALDIIYIFLGTGGGLLGIGTFERFGPKGKYQ